MFDYLYQQRPTALLKHWQLQRKNFRKAFDHFTYLNELSPNYKDTGLKLEEAITGHEVCTGVDESTISRTNSP